MRRVGKPKISASVNPWKTSSKDPIGLNIDYIGKGTFGYHLKDRSTIKKGWS